MPVYFIQNTVNLAIKIGVTNNVKQRVRTLKTASADKLRLVGAIDGGRSIEQAIHQKFAHCRLNLEWFRPEPDLVEFITTALHTYGGGRPWMVNYGKEAEMRAASATASPNA